jgi:predicted GIY-YIG superfamily endonuclease
MEITWVGPEAGAVAVYVVADANDVCLYVGQSKGLDYRMYQHQYGGWGPEVAAVYARLYATRREALHAEGVMIELMGPIHNVVHAHRKLRPKPASLAVTLFDF